MASGEAVVFVDSDMVLDPDVAAESLAILADRPELGALVIPERSFGPGFLAASRALEKELYLGADGVEAARVFRRRAFAATDGYDERIGHSRTGTCPTV